MTSTRSSPSVHTYISATATNNPRDITPLSAHRVQSISSRSSGVVHVLCIDSPSSWLRLAGNDIVKCCATHLAITGKSYSHPSISVGSELKEEVVAVPEPPCPVVATCVLTASRDGEHLHVHQGNVLRTRGTLHQGNVPPGECSTYQGNILPGECFTRGMFHQGNVLPGECSTRGMFYHGNQGNVPPGKCFTMGTRGMFH